MTNVNAMLEIMFEGVQLKRWNGIFKAEDFVETAKQGMNAGVAFILAKMYEEQTGKKVNYSALIDLSICRMVYKVIFTDINPRISYSLLNGDLTKKSNEYALAQLRERGFDNSFCKAFSDFLSVKDNNHPIEMQIFHAASKIATMWEFKQIKPGAGQNYHIQRIEDDIKERIQRILSLEVAKDFILDEKLNNFIDLHANTAFIRRWARFEMTPKISDLSHMYITAVITYLFMCSVGMSEERCIEGFYAGLFHDLLEVLTGDLPYGLKKGIPGLKERLTEIEVEEYGKVIEPLLPNYIEKDVRKFVLSNISEENRVIMKAADNVSAYAEAVMSVVTGISHDYFVNVINKGWKEYKNYEIEGIKVKNVYKYLYDKYLVHKKQK